jgi:hypothetical protein
LREFVVSDCDAPEIRQPAKAALDDFADFVDDLLPLNWSIPKYFFAIRGRTGIAENAVQAGGDCCQVAAGGCPGFARAAVAAAVRSIGVTEVTRYVYGRLSRRKPI